MSVTNNRGITSLNQIESKVGIAQHNCRNVTLFVTLISWLFAVNGDLDVLSNDLFTKKFLAWAV